MPRTKPARTPLVAAAGSHPGLMRENNEDRYLCDPARGLFAVIDGVGGEAAGETAAQTALSMIRARLERETGSPVERIREAITLANNEIFRLAGTDRSWAGMACVLTVALVRDGRVTVGHVGDTRLYVFDEAGMAKVTHDHSPIGEREDQGEIDEAAAMRHPRRNEIFRDVGSERRSPGDADFIETVEFPFGPDSAFLLCTDGLSDMVPSARLTVLVRDHASDPASLVERLIEAANRAGGKDNVTAVFVAGPAFAKVAAQRLSAASPPSAGRRWPIPVRAMARSVGAVLRARPLILLAGIALGLAAAYGALSVTDAVPNWVLERARPDGWSRTWRVGPGADVDFPTIDAALVHAQPGDRIEVEPGDYEGPVVFRGDVTLVSRRPREAVIRPRAPTDARAAAAAPVGSATAPVPGAAASVAGATASVAVIVAPGARGRIAGFTITGDSTRRLDVGIQMEDASTEIDDVEVSGAVRAGVVFGARARGTLAASAIHDNLGPGIVVGAEALPRLLHNTITGNGKATPPSAAIVVHESSAPQLVGNIVAGNGDDQVQGLPPARRGDVVRDNVIGLGGSRPPAPGHPERGGAPPRRRDTGGT